MSRGVENRVEDLRMMDGQEAMRVEPDLYCTKPCYCLFLGSLIVIRCCSRYWYRARLLLPPYVGDRIGELLRDELTISARYRRRSAIAVN
ncbi:L-2-hydroxyglutarate dehydrogenase, mitochondrial-like [Salvia divinorum]|uniref:L-2-hydroxyglutarate dehydrogenase, mitochondrial-like n=1 Tax=Salvia divinorum TaxID=28513 RepID=A0ABD1G0M4_SALDI